MQHSEKSIDYEQASCDRRCMSAMALLPMCLSALIFAAFNSVDMVDQIRKLKGEKEIFQIQLLMQFSYSFLKFFWPLLPY